MKKRHILKLRGVRDLLLKSALQHINEAIVQMQGDDDLESLSLKLQNVCDELTDRLLK